MRALFVTVASNEIYMPVSAWRNSMGPAGHITFNAHQGNDEAILACAEGYKPDVIFYIGCNTGRGMPSPETLKSLRGFAPSILYQSDVEDEAWWPLLELYREKKCFDLMVSQTGVKTDLIDKATLIAVDLEAYTGAMNKDKFCGFAGSVTNLSEYISGVSQWDGRAEILKGLVSQVDIRPREPTGGYRVYADWMKACISILNVSLTGSGKRHHVKWRVLEAAFADCALLEMKGSPLSDWFPRGTYIEYETVGDARRTIQSMRLREFASLASEFSGYAREHYTPRQIYQGILEAL